MWPKVLPSMGPKCCQACGAKHVAESAAKHVAEGVAKWRHPTDRRLVEFGRTRDGDTRHRKEPSRLAGYWTRCRGKAY